MSVGMLTGVCGKAVDRVWVGCLVGVDKLS